MAWRFRPPLWAWAGMMALGAILLSLGTWQMSRAQHKRALEGAYAKSGEGGAVRLTADIPVARSDAVTRVTARGHYLAGPQIFLDNQPRNRIAGYRVWTPLQLETGGWVLVDRGWVPADPDRRVLPELAALDAATREVDGYWRPFPEPGLRLADPEPCNASLAFPRVLNFPTRETLACVLGRPVLPGLLLLDAEAPDGFVREWTLPNPVPPARHYAYAAQWYAFAATLLFLFVKLNLRRS